MSKFSKFIHKYLSEQQYLTKLFYNLQTLNYSIPLFPDGGSGNASLLYTILKCLYIKKPKRILEFGSGQSTILVDKFLSQHPDSHCLTIEDDEQWYNLIKEKVTQPNHDYIRMNLKPIKVKVNGKLYFPNFYQIEDIRDRFNLILLDGPKGSKNRLGLLNYIHSLIDPTDFVIILDDINRKYDAMLGEAILKHLRGAGIECSNFLVYGRKYQSVILSENNNYLRTV